MLFGKRWNMRRSRIDTIIDMLEAAKIDANKTNIICRTDLNLKIAEKYLNLLQKHGLMDSRSGKYITTEKGKCFLKDAKAVTPHLECS